ncbi:MAG: dihydroxy-acid dehydratase, partial [Caulobacter sp.]
PNGAADVNQFHAAGGMAFVVRELLDAGLVHDDVLTVAGRGLRRYQQEPHLDGQALVWRDGAAESLDLGILRPIADPFEAEGGIRQLAGGLGRAVIKVSAVAPSHRVIRAPAVVFETQEALQAAFRRGDLDRDLVAIVRFQGPRANGMPELHGLSPVLSVLQDRGHQVALVTDGRMSGASGRVPAAIHLTPEAAAGGPLALVRDGDMIRLDCAAGVLDIEADLTGRLPAPAPAGGEGYGRELFDVFRRSVGASDAGASSLF